MVFVHFRPMGEPSQTNLGSIHKPELFQVHGGVPVTLGSRISMGMEKQTLLQRWVVKFLCISPPHPLIDLKTKFGLFRNIWGNTGFTWAADFNGDGKADIASAVGGQVHMRLSTAEADHFDSMTWQVPNRWGSSDYTWVADFNGDGKADIASAEGDLVYIHFSLGNKFKNEVWPNKEKWGNSGYTWTTDFTGDGKADIVTVRGNLITLKRSGEPANQFIEHSQNTPYRFRSSGRAWASDFTGNGPSDLAFLFESGSLAVLKFFKEPYVEGAEVVTFLPYSAKVDGRWGSESYTWVGDFNGDGKADIASADAGFVYMRLSKKSELKMDYRVLQVPNRWGSSDYTWVADFNGNGKIDIASAHGNNVYMLFSSEEKLK